MKRIPSTLLFSAFSLLLLPIFAAAQDGGQAPKTAADLNCSVDIAENIPTSTDWATVYIARAEDGSAWQRAPLRDHHQLLLSDSEMATIEGTANSYSDVQLFIYSPQDNGGGGLRKPDFATCINVGKADKEGNFTFSFNSRMLWEMLGQDIIVDAFYKMEEDWEKVPGEVESQNFFIGTHSFPSQMTVAAAGDPKDCPLLCNESNMVEGVSLDPLQLDPKLLGSNFDDLGGRTAVVARSPGEHTFYAGSTGDNERDQKHLTEVALKSLSMERLKRVLLGNPYAGNRPPGIDPLTPEGLRDAAASKGSSSAEIQQLVRQLRTLMTNEDYQGDLKLLISQNDEGESRSLFAYLPPADSLDNLPNTPEEFPDFVLDENGMPVNLPQQVQNLGGQTPTGQARPKPNPKPKASNAKKSNPPKKGGGGGKAKSSNKKPARKGPPGGAPAPKPPAPKRAEVLESIDNWFLPPAPELTAELFPPNVSTNETWPEDLLNMINFWTGGLEKNDCLALDDVNFERSITKGDMEIDADYICQYSYVGGLTPQILLNSAEAVELEPKFVDARIVEADTAFTAANGWQLAAGKKSPVAYRYEFTADFPTNRIAEFCTQKSRLSNFFDSVSAAYGLTSAETSVLASEINKEVKNAASDDFLTFRLADPSDIAARFVWNGNGEQLDILGLFFEIETNTCTEEKLDLPFSPIQSPERDGFEVGILE